jgi:hypothetical protein
MKICAEINPGMGLSNRIRLLVSAMRIAKKSGKPYCLYWPVSEKVPCQFGDLFEMPVQLTDSPQGNMLHSSWRLWVDEAEVPENWAKAYPSDDVKGRAIDFEFDRIPQAIREKYLAQFARLHPRVELVWRADVHAAKPLVGVHVRDGIDWDKWGRTVALENFLAVLDRYPPRAKFYLSAHRLSTVKKIVSRYPGRVVYQENKVYSGPSVKRMQDALVDMLCLARCTELVGTYASTFTEMAWWFSGCRQKVTIVEGDRSKFKWF